MRLLFIVLGFWILCICILASVPPVLRDELIHHLLVPKYYIALGGMAELPHIPFSYYPMNLQMLYWLALYFHLEILPKYIHFAFGLMTTAGIFHYIHYRINKHFAILGAVFFLSIPVIVKLSISAYVDLGLVCFSFFSIYGIILWIDHHFHWKYLVLSAVCCGLCLGTKYNGLVIFLILSLFVAFVYSKYASQTTRYLSLKAMGVSCCYILISLMLYSPWLIRNYLWTHNPIYPLYDSLFQRMTKTPEISTQPKEEQGESVDIFTMRKVEYGESWVEIMMLPLRIFFQGKDNKPKYFDGVLNPFLLLLPILGFFWKSMNFKSNRIYRDQLIFLTFVLMYFVYSFFTTVMRIRYISPMIPCLVILSVFGLKQVYDRIHYSHRHTYALIWVVIISTLYLAYNGQYLKSLFDEFQPIAYASGKITKDEYIERFCPEYPLLKYINETLPMDSVVLYVFIGKRGYYCERKYIPDTQGNIIKLINIIRNANSAKAIYHDLKSWPITHVLIHIPFMKKTLELDCNMQQQTMFADFIAHYTQCLRIQNNIGLYELNITN
ncbi:MAG: glycosyltransferase family 39 protein [Desulfobacterales bacterium]|nr:glycosyltransferase family 39 protein [Desulfobacterales bacterium]